MNGNNVIRGGAAAVLLLAMPLITYYEGYYPQAYADPIGVPTECYGHTQGVKFGDEATPQKCQRLLGQDAELALEAIRECIRVPLEPWQAAALVSFTFNVGGNALCGSTMVKLANAGAPAAQWCQQMRRWTYATKAGVVVQLPGLIKRREAETKLCLGEAA